MTVLLSAPEQSLKGQIDGDRGTSVDQAFKLLLSPVGLSAAR